MLENEIFHWLLLLDEELGYNFLQELNTMGLNWKRVEKLREDSLDGLSQELVFLVQIDEAHREVRNSLGARLGTLLVGLTFNQG